MRVQRLADVEAAEYAHLMQRAAADVQWSHGGHAGSETQGSKTG